MGFFKDLKADFSAAINDLVPGGDDSFVEDEIPDDSQTLSQDLDAEAEFSKLDGLLEKVENKAKQSDDAIFKPIEIDEPASEEVLKTDVVEVEEAPVIDADETTITESIPDESEITSAESELEAPVIDAIASLDAELEAEKELELELEAATNDELASLSDEEDIVEDTVEDTVEDIVEDTVEDIVEDAVENTDSVEVASTEDIDLAESNDIAEDVEVNSPSIEESELAEELTNSEEVTTIELEPIDAAFTFEDEINKSYEEDNKMDAFTSITPEVTESVAEAKETEISLEISDEVSIITEGTKIKGNMETAGSFEIRGHIEGDLKCNGKLTVTGTVLGSSSSSEFFADASHVEGEIVSSGTVKIGLGSVIMGNITATSAVIAGAVKGDIDVQGPVVVDSSAVILGNIKSKSVVINNGAVIEGFCSQCYSDVDVEGLFGKSK